MSRLTEQRDVQDRLIHYLQGLHWTFVPRYDLPAWRGNDEREPFLHDVLRTQIAALNGWPVGDPRLDAILRRLRLLEANLAGNEEFLQGLRNQWTAYDPTQQREFNVTLIDYENLGANTFHFTEEMWVQDRDRRRMDMVLFVNGLPVVLVENKSPRLQDSGLEGFHQVQTTYTTFVPEFLRYPIPFVVAASRLEYGPTWNPSTKAFYRWKDPAATGAGAAADFGLEGLARSFFARDQVLRLLRDYTLFYRIDDSTQKYLLRPHQMRAVEKIVARVAAGADDLAAPDTGLEWHTQGSGKTLTMIVAASLLRRHPALDNPTILIVVDRLELEAQMLLNLEAYGLPAVQASSKRRLAELLRHDTRGVIVTTIHKFDDMRPDILTRRNVVVLVDEAHRSQEGDLGIALRGSAARLFFGFTGTPIDRSQVGRGTFRTFGSPADREGYHDKYSINESIEDGTTVPLYYTLAPTQLSLDRAQLDRQFAVLLDEFYTSVDTEGAGSQEALSRLLQRADKLLAVLKAPQRIEAIAAHIAAHFQAHVLPLGFKAMIVTPDREACMLYKRALDQYLDPQWSVVVYSANARVDSADMQALYLDAEAEQRVRKDFRDPDKLPKILIVTEKLLTGYDAPVAYAMYLDKPLKDHTLLQAIARINRPYPHKNNGVVVDYIGVFEDMQRALSFDQQSYQAGLVDLEQLRLRFLELLDAVEAELAPVAWDQVEKRVERALLHFYEESVRAPFLALTKELSDAWVVLSPDPFLQPYMDRYHEIMDVVACLAILDPAAEERRVQAELLGRTEQMIRGNVTAYTVASPLPLYPITRSLADVIRNDQVDERVKVINLRRSIALYIEEHGAANPYLQSLAGQVEEIIEQLHQRQISATTALEQLTGKAEQAVAAQEERAASELDNLAFSLRMTLRAHLPVASQQATDVVVLAQGIAAYLRANGGWRQNPALESQVRLELLKRVLAVWPKPPNPAEVARVVEDLLKMQGITG